MPYISHLLNSKVRDSSEAIIGKLEDILVKATPGDYAPVSFLAIRLKNNPDLVYIPYAFVETLSKEEVSLNALFNKIKTIPIKEEEWICLRRNVLDQQIVDLSGARVVRVNDLRIGEFNGHMSVLGIDVGIKGLLRRLGFTWLGLERILAGNLIDWRHAQLVHNKGIQLNLAAKSLTKLHPADLANILESLSLRHGSGLVQALDAKDAAKVLEEVDPHLQKILVKYLGPEQAASILTNMSTDEVVDLMKMLPKEEARLFLNRIQKGKVKKLENLFLYEDDTAGGLMTLDYLAFSPEKTVGEAIAEIKRASPSLRSIVYIYIVDADNVFLGSVSMRWLLISDNVTKLGDLLKNYPISSTLSPEDDVEEIMNVMTKYDLYTAVVLDDNKKLLGVVTIDDVMRLLAPKA